MTNEDVYCVVCDCTVCYEYGKHTNGGRFNGWPDNAIQIETTGN